MRPQAKRTVLVLAALVFLAQLLLLPRLVRWIDGRVTPKLAEAAALDGQYREMTNALPIAGEVMPGHPTRQLWEDRRAALLAAGYVETRVIRMKNSPSTKNWFADFRRDFGKSFPGVELTTRSSGGAASAEVTARVADLRAIERFVENYQAPK